jgi:hypothetical protein
MMPPQPATRRDLETALIEKCWKDPEFKKTVLNDPKGMLELHIGQNLPAQIKVFIHEEDANTLHFSIPVAPSNLTELSDDDLERVAGGTDLVLTVTALFGAIASAASAAGASAVVGVATGAW